MHPSGLDISLPRRSERGIIDKTCPDLSDINVTRDILVSLGARNNFIISGYSRRLEYVVSWMKVKSCILYAEEIDVKSEAGKS
jgi:hypothetical protein